MHIRVKNTKLIRLESENGNGPFNESERLYRSQLDPETVNHAAQFKYRSHTRMNCAATDFGDVFTEDHFCAYVSLQGFLHFWNDELTLIAFLMSGFKLYELTVSECCCTETQAAFLKKDVLNKREIPFNEVSQYYQQKAA